MGPRHARHCRLEALTTLLPAARLSSEPVEEGRFRCRLLNALVRQRKNMAGDSMRIVVMAVVCLLVFGLAAVSRVTSRATWTARMACGEWAIRVQDEQGDAIPDASLRVVHPETGETLSYGAARSDGAIGPFDNYTGPGSVTAGADGVIRLRNTRRLRYGGEYWKLFWIWIVGADPGKGPHSLLLELSAPGHESARVSVNDVWSAKETVLKLS